MRIPHAVAAALLSMTTLACATDDPVEPATEERFVGQWFIEETEAHALYAATVYELTTDGEVAVAWNADLYPEPHGYVRSPDGTVACFLSSPWSSVGDDVLVVAGACSDEVARDIELVFTSDASGNAAGADVVIGPVGGELGWQPPQWGWSFTKCLATDACHPEL